MLHERESCCELYMFELLTLMYIYQSYDQSSDPYPVLLTFSWSEHYIGKCQFLNMRCFSNLPKAVPDDAYKYLMWNGISLCMHQYVHYRHWLVKLCWIFQPHPLNFTFIWSARYIGRYQLITLWSEVGFTTLRFWIQHNILNWETSSKMLK